MKKTINYLDKSNNIVSIPTIRLVVIDLLLLLSRLLISINPEEKEPNNFYSDSEKRKKVDDIYENITEPVINEIRNYIVTVKDRIEIYINKEWLSDFDYIIQELDLSNHKVRRRIIHEFDMGKTRENEGIEKIFISRKMGEHIQKILKALVDENSKERGPKLYFPLKTTLGSNE